MRDYLWNLSEVLEGLRERERERESCVTEPKKLLNERWMKGREYGTQNLSTDLYGLMPLKYLFLSN